MFIKKHHEMLSTNFFMPIYIDLIEIALHSVLQRMSGQLPKEIGVGDTSLDQG